MASYDSIMGRKENLPFRDTSEISLKILGCGLFQRFQRNEGKVKDVAMTGLTHLVIIRAGRWDVRVYWIIFIIFVMLRSLPN